LTVNIVAGKPLTVTPSALQAILSPGWIAVLRRTWHAAFKLGKLLFMPVIVATSVPEFFTCNE